MNTNKQASELIIQMWNIKDYIKIVNTLDYMLCNDLNNKVVKIAIKYFSYVINCKHYDSELKIVQKLVLKNMLL